MTCSRCGRSPSQSSGLCASCEALAGPGNASGVAVGAPRDEDLTAAGETGAGDPASAPPDPDATKPGAPSADPDATRLGFNPPPARASSDAAQPGSRTAATGSSGDSAGDLVGRPLGRRYQILRLLGAGGMGAVYQAWDQELGVVVALKTVRPEIAADPDTAKMLDRRFKQELLLARQVTHKNIVRVHDMGEVDGIKYITMPYLEGEDLATILKRRGKLPPDLVTFIARQVASGLAAAHEAGVVHRDLKPANIMIDAGGDALIMDFGVARSTGAPRPVPGSATDEQLRLALSAGQTMIGSVVGTIEYMAPEQARAEPVDQRADIYAFGLILYDLLLGRTRASRTHSAFAELTLRMKEPPPPARSLDPQIPDALDRIITRCIHPDANARYQTTAELVAELGKLDDHGRPLPMMRRLTWRMTAAAAVVVASLLGLTWWLARGPEAPVEHEPLSVLIADLRNGTGDTGFDGTLEPILKFALEGAGFISAYDRSAVSRGLGVHTPDNLTERAAMEIAVKQGLGVVVSGSVDRQGSRYAVSVKATQPVTGQVITSATESTSSREQVLGMVTRLATSVREALGDDTSGSAQRFAMETLSATSLEVVREYAVAMEALSRSKFDEARQSFSKAVALDPNFGLAYAGLAITSRNVDRQEDAEKYVKEAIRHLDGMTERERYRTRGLFYYLTGDYQACVKEYGDLIARYSADVAARNNRALCLTYLRKMPEAVAEMRQVVKILPNRALYRENLALYSDYNGDFQAAEQEVQAMQEPGLFGQLAVAFAAAGLGQLPRAAETYRALGKIDDQGASYTASGLGDLGLYEGRFSDAARVLSEGAAADLASGDPERAANKFATLGHVHLERQQTTAASAAAEKALANSKAVKIRFLAGRIFVEAGATGRAGTIRAGLAAEPQPEPQAYARILEGMSALKAGNASGSIQSLTEANRLLDTWIGHFELGRAHLAAGELLKADSEFDRCISRRGEALALFLDEEPTYGFFPPVYYYQGRVREGLNNARFAESYRAYLDIRGRSTEDPLLPDVRRRAARQPE
jgi:eukaryotic-like serine/threonine-protein kinase